MTKAEVQKLKARLEAEYRKKLEAVALVEQLLAEEERKPARSTNGVARAVEVELSEDEEGDSDTLIGRIEKLFDDPEKRWTVARIEHALREQGYKFQGAKPSTSIHTCIAKLKKRRRVRVLKHGSGSKPSIYGREKLEQPEIA